MKLKCRSIDVEMLPTTGPTKEVAREGEEMNHGTLWYFKWELGFEKSGSQWTVGKLLAWCSLLHLH